MIMEHRRFHRPTSPSSPITGVVGGWFGVYTVILGLTVWHQCLAIPVAAQKILWETGILAWAFTLGLLLVIRHAVVSRLVRPLRQQVMVDALTGVLRPGAFWEQADVATRALTAAHNPWVFAYLDLDDFKQVNDLLGHQAGDTVLQAFGTLLRTHARHHDLVGRLGGEEFGWILSGCTTEDALAPVQRLLAAFHQMDGVSCGGPCSFSAGVAGWQEGLPPPVSVWDIAQRADRALYQAKTHGKGCVEVE